MIKIIIFCSILTYSFGSYLVLKAKYNIKYKAVLKQEDFELSYVKKIPLGCKIVTVEDFISAQYRAKVFINRGRVLCQRDLYIPQNNKVVFDFGSIQIEKYGKIIKETDKYIRFKNIDGTIQTIYKNGIQ